MSDARLTAEIGGMIDAFAHRGPDGRATWTDEMAGVSLGHRRLAVIDLSPTGIQPMSSRSGRWVLTYNGEIYNHRDLRVELEAGGAHFRGTCDAETLVEGFDMWGVEATLRRTNGMFGLGVWDRRDRCLTIARDRIGEKPVYWTADERHFAFASELKGLTALSWFDRTVDCSSVASVLGWGFVARPGTIYRGAQQLEPGQLLQVQVIGGRVHTVARTWWSLRDTVAANVAQQRPTTLHHAVSELEPLLASAVSRRMQSDVPLGAFLSGGIDSTLIAALAQRSRSTTPLNTFTVQMPEFGTDESVGAANVAERLGTHHTTVELQRDEALAIIPTLATVWDEPFGDPSMIPSLLLCRAARQHLTVCLGGDGGDELFAGYNRHALTGSILTRTRRMPLRLRTGLGRGLRAVPPHRIDHLATRFGALVPQRRRLINPGDKAHKLGAMLQADDAHVWASLAGVWSGIDGARVPQPPPPPTGLNPVEHLLWADTAMVLADNMLVKVDRASMANGLEVRTPFLDLSLLEWAWRQPLSVKTAGGVGKLVLRNLVAELGLGDVAARPKVGFDPPLAAWLRGPLRSWASDLLVAPRAVADGYLRAHDVDQVWQEHLVGRRNNEYQLWALLMLESWFRSQS